MKNFWLRFWKEEDGQDLVEYSLILAFVALSAAALLTTMGTSINTIWTAADGQLGDAAAAVAP
jgi:Flp pilus assembly pilin Flp